MNRKFDTSVRKPGLERLALFAVAFVFWLFLAWPVSPLDGRLIVGDVVVGLVVAAFVALVMQEMIRVNFVRLIHPAPWGWMFVYMFVFSWYVIKGGLDVAFRVLHPDMPIRPGVVKVRSVLKTATGRTVLANAITLTPGTLTMDVTDDGIFYVHWINVTSMEEEQAAEQILRRFEWYINKIFE